MKKSLIKWSSIAAMSALLVACQEAETSQEAAEEEEEQAVESELEENEEEEIHNNEDEEHNQEESNHDHDHDEEGHDHDHVHDHAHDEDSQRIYDGYFEDEEVEDRDLSDWEGEWQSVYPYLQDGDLDEVFEHKAEENEEMTEEEYKKYYEEGYETDVDHIVIEGSTVTFSEDEEEYSGEYTYDGYEILTYEAGNRGVRFIFELTEENEDMPQFIQFSDHNIFPTDSDHFHLYWGDDREELLDNVTNWPTYYPSELDSEDIVHEMIAH